AEKCDEALASSLPHTAFTSSSVFSNGYAPGYAKLNRRGEGAGGWSPLDSDHYQWLQVDLGSRKQVIAIATQGRYSSSDWTTRYRLLYSDTGRNWKPYHQDGNIWAFSGNSNSESVVRHELQQGTVVRFLRFVPLEWSEEGRIGLRIEVYGCSYCEDINMSSLPESSSKTVNQTKKWCLDINLMKVSDFQTTTTLFAGKPEPDKTQVLKYIKAELIVPIGNSSIPHSCLMIKLSLALSSAFSQKKRCIVICLQLLPNPQLSISPNIRSFRILFFPEMEEFRFGQHYLKANEEESTQKRRRIFMKSAPSGNGGSIFAFLANRSLTVTKSGSTGSFNSLELQSFPIWITHNVAQQCVGSMCLDALAASKRALDDMSNGLLGDLPPKLDWGISQLFSSPRCHVRHWLHRHMMSQRCPIAFREAGGATQSHQRLPHSGSADTVVLSCTRKKKSRVLNHPFQAPSNELLFFGWLINVHGQSNKIEYKICHEGVKKLGEEAGTPAAFHLIYLFQHNNFHSGLLMCYIRKKCMPNHCEHGGRCKQSWDSFSCTCDGTGYTGATCHTSIYEPSCEAYKHLGRSSDTYWIDPDGSGPLAPFKVSCNMTEDKVWTTVMNNLPAKTTITGSSKEKRTVLQVNYSASMDQVTAITTSAESCEQHISYSCRMSRLLNTPDGTPFTWWVGQGNEKHFYWGGSAPGIQKCACGMDRNCTDTKYDCNCDADHNLWREDSGLLGYKEHLPVSQVAVGDTNRPGSEAKMTVGPLRCQGDSDYWNAASFTTPSSYLHFATFQGETSADISFYFKTSAPYGVFLENLGNTDFIRLELKSPKVVSFSFDVGNGPVELTVHSGTPLNDDQWHQVMAERNVKEAVLQLDQMYRAVRLAPAQGHTRLELFSQLYVGAAGGQRGFLGCIRALRMNGVTLDLEERAMVTPGVKPGCQGHCTSFGMYCRNGGKCVEKYNGYLCDCSATAYDGPFCTRDIGGFFEAGTLVKYNFLPEAVAGASRDAKTLHHQPKAHGVNLTTEDVAFSFSTSSAPAVLMYISSKTEDFMAVLLRQNGSLQVRYNLGGLKAPFSIDVDQRNLANGQPHVFNMSRVDRSITIQLDHYPPVSYTLPDASDTHFNLVKTLFLGKVFETGHVDPLVIEQYNTPGFVGCLSRVRFNGIAPIKSALRAAAPTATQPGGEPAAAASPVSYQGKLVESNCGASPLTIPPMSAATDPWRLDSTDAEFPFNEERVIPDGVNRDSAIIGGIIAVVIFTILCTLVFLIRYMFRHKGTYHTNEAKGSGESAGESADTAIIGTDNPETIDESKKEWFI
uniref:Contactin associated protein 2 n=1 Tax=Tetraodon nigroviridis TaxID=99883 RepID=H3CRS5_TETNG